MVWCIFFFIFPLWEGQCSLLYILYSAHFACVPKCAAVNHFSSCCYSSHILLFSSHCFLLRSMENICSLSPFQILAQPHYMFLYLLVFFCCHVFGLYPNCKPSFLSCLITVSYCFLPHFCTLHTITTPSV